MVIYALVIQFLILIPVAWAADQTVTVDNGEPQFSYQTVNRTNENNGASWVPINRSAQACDTPQHITKRVGDSVIFSFTGTSIVLLGTTSPEGGVITFTFDGQNSTISRHQALPKCDEILFQQTGLALKQHNLVVTLSQQEVSPTTGQLDGLLSIQRARYTIPGESKPASKPTGAIVGGVVGGGVVLVLVVALIIFLRRRKRNKKRQNRSSMDVTPTTPRTQALAEGHPGSGITPFVWTDRSTHTHSPPITDHHGPAMESLSPLSRDYPQYEPTPSTSSSDPSSSRGASSSRPTRLATGYLDHNSQDRRENPRPRNTTMPPTLNDDMLVDRVAHRLADIMRSRAGMSSPPIYDDAEFFGRDPNALADLHRRVEQRVQDIQQERNTGQGIPLTPYPDQRVAEPNTPVSPRGPGVLYPPLLQRNSTSYAIDPNTGYGLEKFMSTTPSPPALPAPPAPPSPPVPSPEEQRSPAQTREEETVPNKLPSLPPGAAAPKIHRSMSPDGNNRGAGAYVDFRVPSSPS